MYGNEGCRLLKCPYDPNHIIRGHRLPYHIRKCRNNHPEVKLRNCVYNFGHLIKAEDFLDHLGTCPNKGRIDSNHYDDISLEHGSCQNEYDEITETDSDACEVGFRLVEPLAKDKQITEKDKLDYLALQRKYAPSMESSVDGFNSDNGRQIEEDEELPPLQLPKTKSKAFQIRKSHSGKSESDSYPSRSLISKYSVASGSSLNRKDTGMLTIADYSLRN